MLPRIPSLLFLISLVYLILVLAFHFQDHPVRRRIRSRVQSAAGRVKTATTNVTEPTVKVVPGVHVDDVSKEDSVAKSWLRKPKPLTGKVPDAILPATRAYWMSRANQALWDNSDPCPFAAFASVIVNHTEDNGLGEVICTGVNSAWTGNPTLHGEIAAINNCTAILTDPKGHYRLSGEAALQALRSLSLYTNGEPCPMCASAIRWGGFKECIYGTTIKTLIAKGWNQIDVETQELFDRATYLPGEPRLIGEVLTNETDPLFSWQFDKSYSCPVGCSRGHRGTCEPVWAHLERLTQTEEAHGSGRCEICEERFGIV